MSRKLMLFVALAVAASAAALEADTVSKKINWTNDKWITVNMTSEGITIKDIRFSVEGGIHWNPLRAGTGPQCFVQVKNESNHNSRLAVAIVLYDEKGDLIAATESSHIGELEPNEQVEIKMTFRDVKRRFFEAKAGQIVLETYR